MVALEQAYSPAGTPPAQVTAAFSLISCWRWTRTTPELIPKTKIKTPKIVAIVLLPNFLFGFPAGAVTTGGMSIGGIFGAGTVGATASTGFSSTIGGIAAAEVVVGVGVAVSATVGETGGVAGGVCGSEISETGGSLPGVTGSGVILGWPDGLSWSGIFFSKGHNCQKTTRDNHA